MGLECFIAAGHVGLVVVVVAFTLVVFGVSVVWTFGPIVVVPRNPAWIGFLLVVLVALIVIRAFAIVRAFVGTLALLLVFVDFFVCLSFMAAHVVDNEFDCGFFLDATVDHTVVFDP